MSWAAVARAQAGVVSRGQLRDAGLGRTVIDSMVRDGALVSRAAGIYLVRGAPFTYDASLWVAVLRTGGVLSHATAAHLWGMLDESPDRTHVTVRPARRLRTRPNIALHRLDVQAKAITVHWQYPVTTRVWTALDHLCGLPFAEACSFADRALQQRWLTHRDIERRLADWPRRWGNSVLTRIAAVTGKGAEAESERLLHQLLRTAGFTGWVAQYAVYVAGRFLGRTDVAFPDARLAIEVDGWAYHSQPERFQRDRSRQNSLVAAGWTVLRFTWRDLTERPDHVIALIKAALA